MSSAVTGLHPHLDLDRRLYIRCAGECEGVHSACLAASEHACEEGTEQSELPQKHTRPSIACSGQISLVTRVERGVMFGRVVSPSLSIRPPRHPSMEQQLQLLFRLSPLLYR